MDNRELESRLILNLNFPTLKIHAFFFRFNVLCIRAAVLTLSNDALVVVGKHSVGFKALQCNFLFILLPLSLLCIFLCINKGVGCKGKCNDRGN